jgi:hypothetical protein
MSAETLTTSGQAVYGRMKSEREREAAECLIAHAPRNRLPISTYLRCDWLWLWVTALRCVCG